MEIHYLVGDAARPVSPDNKIIAHVCNDIGAWGAGFVLAISKRWPQPKAAYLEGKRLGGLLLGTTGLVQVEPDIWVANMIAQRGLRSQGGLPPIRYDSLSRCLTTVAAYARTIDATVHLPRIGCGLAGGKWEIVEPIIREKLEQVPVFVYDLRR